MRKLANQLGKEIAECCNRYFDSLEAVKLCEQVLRTGADAKCAYAILINQACEIAPCCGSCCDAMKIDLYSIFNYNTTAFNPNTSGYNSNASGSNQASSTGTKITLTPMGCLSGK